MGMFDNVQGEVKCLNCGRKFIADDQIKWADCLLRYYTVGDEIPASDGEYTYGSGARSTLNSPCPHCGTWNNFKAVVKNGVLDKLETTGTFEPNNKYW